MTTKVTKKDNYAALTAVLIAAQNAGIDADFDALNAFIDHEVELLDKKAEKAKATASKNKAANDEITDTIKDILTDEPMTIAEVTAAIGDEAITNAKVSYRLTALVKDGFAVKEEVTIPGGEGVKARKLAAYKLAD